MSAGPILQYIPLAGEPNGSGGGSNQRSGTLLYWPDITRLTGGVASSDLDAQDLSGLAADTMIEVKIAGRGGSQWVKAFNPFSPSTNTNSGIIVPTNYNLSTNPYVLNRQSGY